MGICWRRKQKETSDVDGTCWTGPILASITSTCRRHEINVELYLTQLLANLPSTPITQVRQWLPDVWKQRQLAENKSVLIRQA